MAAPTSLLPEQSLSDALRVCEQAILEWEKKGLIHQEGGPTALIEMIGAYRDHPSVETAAAIADCLWTKGMWASLALTCPGAWSHIRKSAGPTWNAVATTTRTISRRVSDNDSRSGSRSRSSSRVGLGTMGVIENELWIADHIILEAQTGLEVTRAGGWYGQAGDADASDLVSNPGTFGNWQRRWMEKVAGKPLKPRWLLSPRWMIPVPAHAIHRSRLTDPLGEVLWRQGCDLSSSIPLWTSETPDLWWLNPSSVPGPSDLFNAVKQGGAISGILSTEAISSRGQTNPAAIPLLLAMAGQGERDPGRCWWKLLEYLLSEALRSWDGGIQDETPTCRRFDRPLEQSPNTAIIWRGSSGTVINTWMISSLFKSLVPSILDLNANALFPPATLLRAGFASLLQRFARPCVPIGANGQPGRITPTDVDKLCWSIHPMVDSVPDGFAPVGQDVIDALVARPSAIEIGGSGLFYDRVDASA